MVRKTTPLIPVIPRRSLPPVLLIAALAFLGCTAPFFRQLFDPSPSLITPLVDSSATAAINATISNTAGATTGVRPRPTGPRNLSTPISNVPPLELFRAENITLTDNAFIYFSSVNALIRVHPKSGSNAVFTFMYHAMFGKPYNHTYCDTYIQNVNGPCWKGKAQFFFQVPLAKRLEILTSNDTMRIAIQRDPYERLISAFKSKFTCERDLYRSDPPKEHMFLRLREQAGLPRSNKLCMTLQEFADCLSSLYSKIRSREISYKHVESHTRPLRFFFEQIKYHYVLDITEAVGLEYIRPFWQLFPYRHTVPNGIVPTHTSSRAKLVVPKDVEEKIRLFATLSETRENPGFHMFAEDTEPEAAEAAGEAAE